jgi:putative SbcD/Mre11-related phosphoesterase
MFEGWQLTPEGAAIHAGEQTAVVADLHLGYEWARGAAGDCMFAHSLDETLARLVSLLDRALLTRLIVAGDLVESSRPCRRTSADVGRLHAWLGARGVRLVIVEGNHDRNLPLRVRNGPRIPSPLPATCTVAGWTIGHGHCPLTGTRTISGHHHPVLRCAGVSAPCFLVGTGRIILPAFSFNPAGCNVASVNAPEDWCSVPMRCIASTGSELLDFGTLHDVRRRLRSHSP